MTQLKEEAERKMAEKDYPAVVGCIGQALALDSEEAHPGRAEVWQQFLRVYHFTLF